MYFGIHFIQNNMNIKSFHCISKAIYSDYYKDLGVVELSDDSTLETLKVIVTPHEGFHKDVSYTIKFESDGWPGIFVDSILFDKIKTKQYIANRGHGGKEHRGICVKNMSYGYAFHKNFQELCGNKWENYIYYLISLFNNLQDFEKGNGFKSSYKEILML
jgi:hypothetical protein